ncbi:hypothetical protein [uncultured Formosa sp.]|uniref:hypothetical protein n=1 Tax=uncultured Formosa sp. TaxID=255435 RepID=UPI00260E2226|nr:hypothetical protein [uncultured Formosa sp.]
MICFNKHHFIISTLIISFCLTASCKQEKETALSDLEIVESTSSTIFVSDNNENEYVVITNSGSKDGMITVYDTKERIDYILKHIENANGTKYKNENGYTLWTKGSAFTWSKDNDIIAKGHLKTTTFEVEKEPAISKLNTAYYGNYVNSGYKKKEDGHDWVAIIIKPIDEYRAKIIIRSRGDKKRGTCTFDAIGNVSSENTLKVIENSINIVFTFTADGVTISTDTETENEALQYFCSGGASLSGTYTKLKGVLDTEQIDKIGYSKTLSYNNVFYNIEENKGIITMTPRGLDIESLEISAVHGEIINVEIDDLNNDTFPEILVYTTSGTDKRGEVFGFSVNNEKSMSTIKVSNTAELNEAHSGYQGHDEFAMVEGTFIQRFPIYENNQPTGKTRQIQYKLDEGDNVLKQLVLDKIVEY